MLANPLIRRTTHLRYSSGLISSINRHKSSTADQDVVVEYLDGNQAGIVVVGLNRPKVIKIHNYVVLKLII